MSQCLLHSSKSFSNKWRSIKVWTVQWFYGVVWEDGFSNSLIHVLHGRCLIQCLQSLMDTKLSSYIIRTTVRKYLRPSMIQDLVFQGGLTVGDSQVLNLVDITWVVSAASCSVVRAVGVSWYLLTCAEPSSLPQTASLLLLSLASVSSSCVSGLKTRTCCSWPLRSHSSQFCISGINF